MLSLHINESSGSLGLQQLFFFLFHQSHHLNKNKKCAGKSEKYKSMYGLSFSKIHSTYPVPKGKKEWDPVNTLQ